MKNGMALLVILALSLAFAGPALALNDWALLVYMVNEEKDSASLEEANIKNMVDMIDVGSTDKVKILVQIDRGPKKSATTSEYYSDPDYHGGVRYVVEKDKWGRTAKLGEVNMGSPYCLWDFLKWAHQNHPAKRYYLTINSHGSGVFSWRGTGGVSSSQPGAVDFNPGRFVAYDSTDNDCLTVFEIAAVLRAFRDQLNMGRPLDILAFDACLPGGIEVLYQFKDVCEFMIGSADTTSIHGFNYGTISQALTKNPDVSAEKIAEYTVKRLADSSLGAWRSANTAQIAFAFNNMSMQLLNFMRENGKKFSLKSISAFGGKERYWDMEKMAAAFINGNSNISGTKSGQLVAQDAKELLEAIKGARLNNYGRISVCWPAAEEYKDWRVFYKALDFSQNTKWDEVLDYRELGIK